MIYPICEPVSERCVLRKTFSAHSVRNRLELSSSTSLTALVPASELAGSEPLEPVRVPSLLAV